MHGEAVVVLVQPNDDNREMYAEFLSGHHFTVVGLSNGDGVAAVAGRADVIVTDLRLTGAIDGCALIAQLRHDRRTKDTPVIVLTPCALPQDREAAKVAGCDRFLAMPCSPQELLEELRDVLLGQVRGRPARVRDATLPTTHKRTRKRSA